MDWPGIDFDVSAMCIREKVGLHLASRAPRQDQGWSFVALNRLAAHTRMQLLLQALHPMTTSQAFGARSRALQWFLSRPLAGQLCAFSAAWSIQPSLSLFAASRSLFCSSNASMPRAACRPDRCDGSAILAHKADLLASASSCELPVQATRKVCDGHRAKLCSKLTRQAVLHAVVADHGA